MTNATTQTLSLANDLFDDLMAGKKKRAIRLGEKEIEPGFLMYRGTQDPSVTAYVWVTDVLHLKLKGAAVKVGQPLEDLIKELSPYYPLSSLDKETDVTLILHLSPEQTTKIFPQGS